ncbi:MAG: ATP synthase F1 subunit epsilon [Pseudomonadota bacterium]|nr:ATP synthase F1 subunit epsilon [Pseudomonadota bacterium]
MTDSVEFELVSPERLIKSEPVEMVVIPGTEGDLGILPGHSLLIATMRPGTIDIYKNGLVAEKIFISGGFAEISPERCTVLAEEALPVNDISREKAMERLEKAKEMLAKAETDDQADSLMAGKEIKKAEAMISAIPLA